MFGFLGSFPLTVFYVLMVLLLPSNDGKVSGNCVRWITVVYGRVVYQPAVIPPLLLAIFEKLSLFNEYWSKLSCFILDNKLNMTSLTDSNASESNSVTAVDYIQNQVDLEREARELMPFDTNDCTYTKGETRQHVFSCLTCSKENETKVGVCYSCSIECHSTHELVELFSKRNFVCDCGTTRMSKTPHGGCKLRFRAEESNQKPSVKPRTGSSLSASFGSSSARPLDLPAEDIPSLSNTYNQNFDGHFCSCEKLYNPLEETATMHQCFFGFVCGEDWFHEDCLLGYKPGFIVSQRNDKNDKRDESQKETGVNLLDRLLSPGPGEDALSDSSKAQKRTQQAINSKDGNNHQQTQEKKDKKERNQEARDASRENKKSETNDDDTSHLDDDDDYDEHDIENAQIIGNYLPKPSHFGQYICWRCVRAFDDIFQYLISDDKVVYTTMPHFYHVESLKEWEEHYRAYKDQLTSENINEPKAKKIKLESGEVPAKEAEKVPSSVFLARGFRNRLAELAKDKATPPKISDFLQNNKYLYEDDPIYEPPRDDDHGSSTTGSLLELGTDALLSLPKEQAIEGAQAYDKIRSKLREFFKPFAEEGKLVTEDEVRSFFSKIKNEAKDGDNE